MLRIAVPNKGSLSDATVELLREAGYRTRRDTKELVVADAENDVEFFYLRPRDIAVYVGSGHRRRRRHRPRPAARLGRPTPSRSCRSASAPRPSAMPAGRVTWPPSRTSPGKRVATSYAGLVRSDLAARGLSAEVVRLDGAVETAITLGSPTASPTSSRPGRRCASRASRSSASRSCGPRPSSSAATARARHQAIEVLQRRIAGVITARDLRHARLRLPEGPRRPGLPS